MLSLAPTSKNSLIRLVSYRLEEGIISLLKHKYIECLQCANTTPGNGDTVVNHKDKNLCAHGAYILEGETNDKAIHL